MSHQTFRSEKDGGVWAFRPDLSVTFNEEPFNWQVEEDKDGAAVLIIIDFDNVSHSSARHRRAIGPDAGATATVLSSSFLSDLCVSLRSLR